MIIDVHIHNAIKAALVEIPASQLCLGTDYPRKIGPAGDSWRG